MYQNKIRMLKCPICKRDFIPGAEHIYKANGRLVCSWKCQRTVEKLKERKGKKVG